MEYMVVHHGDWDYYYNAHQACKAAERESEPDRPAEIYLSLAGWSDDAVKELERWLLSRYPNEYRMPPQLTCQGNILEIRAVEFDPNLKGMLQVELIRRPTREELIQRYPDETLDPAEWCPRFLSHNWLARRLDGGGTAVIYQWEA